MYSFMDNQENLTVVTQCMAKYNLYMAHLDINNVMTSKNEELVNGW